MVREHIATPSLALAALLGLPGAGCRRYVPMPQPTLDPVLVERCRAGDEHACDSAVRTGLATELIDEEIEHCTSGDDDRCERAGRWMVAAMWPWVEIREIFERGCTNFHAGSCAGYVGFLFEGHHFVWSCIDETSEAPRVFESGDTPPIPLTLTAAGPSVPLELEVGELPPGQAGLRACLNEAFEHTRFPALAGEHVTSFEYTPPDSSWIEPHRQTDLTRSYEWDGSMASCPADLSPSCHVLDPPPLRMIYSPFPKLTESFTVLPTAPYSLGLLLEVCVDARGRFERVEVLDDAGAPAVAAVWSETIRTWRAKPAVVDGEAVRSCAHLHLKLEWLWRADEPWREPWRPIIKY